MADYSYVIYGSKGIGKSSFGSKFPGAVFLALEPGDRAMRVRSVQVHTWDDFVGYTDYLVKAADPEVTVVVDVIDLAYEYLYDKICKDLKIESPTDMNDYGATWRRIKRGFREQFQLLLNLPGGKVFLSHDQEKEIELRDGSKRDRVQPTMSKQALGEVEGLVDLVGNYAYDDEDRFLYIRGSQSMVAKCRLEDRFIIQGGTPGYGPDQVRAIPMGDSSQKAFDNFCAAFDNKQLTPDGKAAAVIAAPKRSLKINPSK